MLKSHKKPLEQLKHTAAKNMLACMGSETEGEGEHLSAPVIPDSNRQPFH